jgi:hypothetical protein
MYGMHAIGVHIVWEPAATADTGNDDDILPGNSQGRHYLLDLRQNGIVSATRAPTNFLVGGKILGGKGLWRESRCVAHDTIVPL